MHSARGAVKFHFIYILLTLVAIVGEAIVLTCIPWEFTNDEYERKNSSCVSISKIRSLFHSDTWIIRKYAISGYRGVMMALENGSL